MGNTENIKNKFYEMITQQRIVLAIIMANIHRDKHKKTMSKIVNHDFLQDTKRLEE